MYKEGYSDAENSQENINDGLNTPKFISCNSAKEDTPGKVKLRSWLNKNLKIEMTDGRVLIGIFLCTDQNCNIILGSCQEFLKPEDVCNKEEPRVLGLVMVPGRHIVSIHLDDVLERK